MCAFINSVRSIDLTDPSLLLFRLWAPVNAAVNITVCAARIVNTGVIYLARRKIS